MTTVYTRAAKGSALTWTEGDANITNLNNDKIELTNLSVTDSGGDGSLAYNNTTGVFTYAGPGTSDYRAAFSAGTGITLTDGVIATTITDTNTTYGISAETATGGVNLRLTGSDASTDDVKLAAGSNITLTRTDANTITIEGSAGGISDVVADTSPQLGGSLDVNGQSIVSVSNGNIVLAPNGTGKTKISAVNYNEGAIYDLGTTGGTVAPDVGNGNVQKITLNSALTLNAFTSPVAGQSITLIVYGGTAYTAITSTMKFAGGDKTLTATAGCIDIVSIYYDGTTYFASINKGFA